MKCLFLFRDAPLSPDYAGGASRYFQSFMALHRLGIKVHVWRMLSLEEQEKVLNFEKEEPDLASKVRHIASSWEDVPYTQSITAERLEIFCKSLLQPIEIAFKQYMPLKDALLRAIRQVKPDFIWAEHAWSAALVCASKSRLPWIYAHHDWLYKINRIREEIRQGPHYLSQKILDNALKRSEIAFIKDANGVITGSKTEAAEIAQSGAHHVQLVPTTYPIANINLDRKANAQKVRIVHLGSLTTTANRQGLLAYLERVHPILLEKLDGKLELVIIGKTDGAKPELLQKLQHVRAIFTGHIIDLSTVLVPFDIAIIPYERDTGTRTKLGLLFNFAQVVVTTKAAVAGSEEVEHGQNCLILPSLEHFSKAILSLIQSPRERERLGRAARKTFLEVFTLESQLKKFQKVLEWL